MRSFNPIELGEYAQDSYANYLVGGNQRGYQGLLDGFVSDGEGSKAEQFIRSKGPFLEGVPAAAWGDNPWETFARDVTGSFAPNGLEEAIVEAFTDEDFEYLQRHQEEAIDWLVDDKHALIAAGTGRGKTEAWFIPILQYALRAKRNNIDGVPIQSVKAVLTYPTKALAQDQLKRFIEYLWLVNEKADLPADQKITIGVFDGDTPHRNYVSGSTKDTFTYLIDSFRHFELPDTIAKKTAIDEDTYQNIPPSVNVSNDQNNNEYRLKLREEYGGHEIDFVHLTREKMEETPPDILLTNPDTINYRLFNINDESAHRMFIDQPKFLVFDEVHTYEGLFGAHVSMLVKRLKRLRDERGVDDPLRFIASSATVDEREELFQRLLDIPTNEREDTYRIVEEATPDDVLTDTGTLPSILATHRFSEAELVDAPHESPAREFYETIEIDDHATPTEALETAVVDGRLYCLEHLHRVLQDPTHDAYDIPDSPRPADFVEYIASTYDLTDEAAEIAAANVITLFELIDYEVRVHMFNWPVDGYYKCIHCHRIYSKPETCDCQDHEDQTSFVTKIRLCQHCGEQVYEAWYCPDCATVRPLTQETEGEYLYATKPECNHPDHDDLVRIYWTPEYECTDCGKIEQPSEGLGHCRCGGSLTRTTDGTVCKDPTCDINQGESEQTCTTCGGALMLQGDVAHECRDPECDRHKDEQSGLECENCEAALVPKYSLPWFCTNDDEPHRHAPGRVPDSCHCNRGTFVLPAYVDTQEADFCPECNEGRKKEVYHFPGTGCAIEDHPDEAVERRNKSFNLKAAYRDSNGNIRLTGPSNASHALPCYHGRRRNYDSLMRSPTNAGVTMSQFMLRKLADDNGSQHQSKLMTFADSYRDMERLANDFEEPEKKLFIQQRILDFMEVEGQATVGELLSGTISQARDYWEGIDASEDVVNDVIGYGKWRGTVLSQLIPGTYLIFNGNITRRYGELVNDGMLDISFAEGLKTPEERALCRHLLDNNRQGRQQFLGEISDNEAIENPVAVLNRLKERGIVTEDEEFDRIEFDLDGLMVRYVGSENPIWYHPHDDSFTSSAVREARDYSYDGYVEFTTPYTERATPASPYFDRDAYWAARTNPRLLTSQVYKGDISAEDRRRIEHEFKHDPAPNFLSTGPAMEIGIDIGDLNSLLLMGTPPNTNAYLQRIGRAGRDAGKSLVTTISKRNPIDFYYHKKPHKLISSAEKPIPLDQHNEHVLKVSLTWAIMDYIAANYHIPWQLEELVEGHQITKPDESEWNRYVKDEPQAAPDSDFKTFTSIYHRSVDEIDHGRVFRVLFTIVEEDDAVRPWLENLLEYTYCRNCQHIFNPEVTGTCPECHEPDLRDAADEFSDIIDDVLVNFGDRIVMAAFNYRQELGSEYTDLKEEIRDLEDAGGGFNEFDNGFDASEDDPLDDDAEARLKQLRVQRDMVKELITQYDESSFAEVHERSAASAYVPNLRAFGESVNVKRRFLDSNRNVTVESKDSWDRDSGMALRELHPYAYVLRNKQGYIATEISVDTEGTRQLKDEEKLGPQRLRCDNCGLTTTWDQQQRCQDCGAGPDQLTKIEPIAIQEVEVTEAGIAINDTDTEEIYSLTDYSTNPRSTFAHVTTDIPDFEAERLLSVTDADGSSLFTIEYGGMNIIESVDAYTASYDDGQRDPDEQPITLCMQQNCGSIVVPQGDGSARCLNNPNHDSSKQTEVMIGRTFDTKGLRITSSVYPDTVLHTLAHGLRLALQRTGGVDIRSLQESFEESDDEAYIFESTVGGNGVTDLLFTTKENVHVELHEALEVMRDNIAECNCSTGCPECIYQHGCSEGNRDPTFAKETVETLLTSVLAQDPEVIFTEREQREDQPTQPSPDT